MIRPLPVRKSRGGSQGGDLRFWGPFFWEQQQVFLHENCFWSQIPVPNSAMIMIMMSHFLKLFLSGSLHFRIKFYCSDEDESSEPFCFCHQDDSRPISLERGGGMDVHSREMPVCCWRKSPPAAEQKNSWSYHDAACGKLNYFKLFYAPIISQYYSMKPLILFSLNDATSTCCDERPTHCF